MRHTQTSDMSRKLMLAKPRAVMLPKKDSCFDDDGKEPDFSQVSVFHSISDIRRIPSSHLSNTVVNEMKQNIDKLIKGTETIGDLIQDGVTTLVFKETVIECWEEIENQRYIIYQKPDSEGQLKIKSPNMDDTVGVEEGDPMVFKQCTFFFSDTREQKTKSRDYLSIAIKIATDRKIKFVDCAFVGIEFSAKANKTAGVEFMVFTDSFSKLNLELDNCYFAGVKSVMYTNFEIKSLVINQCTFENIDTDSMSLTNPANLSISNCRFINCKGTSLTLRIFEEELAEKPVKKTSGFAQSTKIENSVVSHA